MKYMILLSGSQRDYDAMVGRAGGDEPGWTAADFAALGSFMESFNRELAESGELVETRGLTEPERSARRQPPAPAVPARQSRPDRPSPATLTHRGRRGQRAGLGLGL